MIWRLFRYGIPSGFDGIRATGRTLTSKLDRRACLLAVALLTGCAQTQGPSTPAATTSKLAKSHIVGPYSVHLLPNGTEMELAGGMPDGTTSAVRQMLEAHPDIRVIHLNSEGGQMLEGYHLSLLIKARHLTTYTSTACASACTIAFLAGSPRYLAENAWLGFHSASLTLGGDSWATGNVALRQLYQEAGLPAAFIDKALATAPSEIWFPPHQELQAAHIVDAVVDSKRFAKSGLAYWKSTAEVDQALRQNTLYAAIAGHDVKAYAQIEDIYLNGARLGRTIAELDEEAADVVIGQFVPRYIKSASDDSVLHYQRIQVTQLQYLQKLDPATCAASAFPALGLKKPDYRTDLPYSLKKESLDALAEVVNSTFDQPHSPGDPSQVHAAMLRYVRKLYRQSPTVFETIREPAKSRDNPRQLCDAATAFLQGVLDQPSEDAAIIARDLMGAKS